MATKLKKIPKQTKIICFIWFLSGCILAWTAGFCISLGWGTYYFNLETGMYLPTGIALCIIAFLVYLVFLFYPASCWKNVKRWPLDIVHIEVIIILSCLAGYFWEHSLYLCIRDSTLLHTFYIEMRHISVVCILFFLPTALLFLTGILLIIRRILLGTLKETSLIWAGIQKWKEATPFEKFLARKNVWSFLFILAGVGCCIWVAFEYRYTLYFSSIMLGSVIILATSIRALLRNHIYRDLGYLIQQIDEMAEGNLNTSIPIPETSELYPASQSLLAIRSNLKSILEKQMKSERMKIELITNVSHDLKTPLTSMIGYVELLKSEPLTNEARDYVEILSDKQEHLKQMIQDIFDLSKSTSGTAEFHLEELDMKKLLEQTLGDMEDAIQKSGMTIRETISETPLKMIGDGKKLYRVLQNLLDNALKYSMKGTRIFVSAKENNEKITVTIKNTAAYEMCFTPEEIMERFSRGDKSRNTEGHGLGLAIAESFVKNMGGELEISIDGDQFKTSLIFDILGNSTQHIH